MKNFVVIMFALFMLTSCSSEDGKILVLDDSKVYYVVFEDKPDIESKEVFAEEAKIGKILSQKVTENDVVVAKISIQNDKNYLITDNAIFYVLDGKLTYDSIGDNGKPVQENSKLLGFDSKTSLFLFKTKNKIKGIYDAVINKIDELY